MSEINTYVDELATERDENQRPPYIDPIYCVRTARILAVSSNPGPAAGGSGSGFLSVNNNDGSARRMRHIYEDVGLLNSALGHIDSLVPWNAYPWYVHPTHANGLSTAMIHEGIRTIVEVLLLAPEIRAIVAHGGDAHQSMRYAMKNDDFRTLCEQREIKIWSARHTSNRAFALPAKTRAAEEGRLRDIYGAAMVHVGLTPAVPVEPVNAVTPVAHSQTNAAAKKTSDVSDHRLMRDPEFRKGQIDGMRAPHVRPVNDFVDRLRNGEATVPYVAPLHGGFDAPLLSVLASPGGGAIAGPLCSENDDTAAMIQSRLMDGAGIAPREMLPWNAYPWRHTEPLTKADWGRGDAVLVELIDQMPNLRVILLQGKPAMGVWQRVVEKYPHVVTESLRVLCTWSPGSRGIAHPDPEVVVRRTRDRIEKWQLAGDILRGQD
ncbi:uracil-DNA glycosylase family protein [Marisediminicola antarctica]